MEDTIGDFCSLFGMDKTTYRTQPAVSQAIRKLEAELGEALFDRSDLMAARADSSASHTEAVTFAVAELAMMIKPQAIVSTTTSGQTPRLVSKFRPKAPILCASWREQTCRQMAVVWGVESILVDPPSSTDDIVANATDGLLRKGRLKVGDQVIITAGVPAGVPGNTNLILTQVVK